MSEKESPYKFRGAPGSKAVLNPDLKPESKGIGCQSHEIIGDSDFPVCAKPMLEI
jgi:hypothetical protein